MRRGEARRGLVADAPVVVVPCVSVPRRPPPAVERLIRENGHIFTEAQCKVCSALLISESQRLAHYQVRSREPPPPGAAGCGAAGR